MELVISSFESRHVKLVIDVPNFKEDMMQTIYLSPYQSRIVYLNNTVRAKGTGIQNIGILIDADGDISVYGVNTETHSSDSFLALPVAMLGNNYYAISWSPAARASQFLVIATANDTDISILFSQNTKTVQLVGSTYTGGDTLKISLGEFAGLQIQDADGDLSGTRITSDKPVAVFSGNWKSDVNKDGTQDHLVEMLLPTELWQAQYIFIPTPDRVLGDFVRFIASEDNTRISIDGVSQQQVLQNAGDVSAPVTMPNNTAIINANHPIQATKFIQTKIYGEIADPSMVDLISPNSFSNVYRFSVFNASTGPFTHTASALVITSKKDGLRLDGQPLTPKITQTVGTYILYMFYINSGSHVVEHIDSNVRFGLSLYGYAHIETYAMLAGLSFEAWESRSSYFGSFKDKKSNEVTIESVYGTTINECAIACMNNVLCRAYNFLGTTRICELKETPSTDADLVNSPGAIYASKG